MNGIQMPRGVGRLLRRLVVLGLVAGAGLGANLRAPRILHPGLGGALVPVPGLVLEGERIAFTFDALHQGPDPARTPAAAWGQVAVSYRIQAQAAQSILLRFIAPSSEAAVAEVNGAPALIQAQPCDDFGNGAPGFRRAPRTGYTLQFQGQLRPGANEVRVVYRQALGAEEYDVSYFTRSRWRTFADYAFWPLKEWRRDPAFTAEITLSVPRRRSLWAILFGARQELRAIGLRNEHGWRLKVIPGSVTRTEDRLVGRFILAGEDLPDLLTVTASER